MKTRVEKGNSLLTKPKSDDILSRNQTGQLSFCVVEMIYDASH